MTDTKPKKHHDKDHDFFLCYEHNSIELLTLVRTKFLELYNEKNRENQVPKKEVKPKEIAERVYPAISIRGLFREVLDYDFIEDKATAGIEENAIIKNTKFVDDGIIYNITNHGQLIMILNNILLEVLRGFGKFYIVNNNGISLNNLKEVDLSEPNLVYIIKDFAAIPEKFGDTYFGYDTGIDGLNTLFNGGLLLPSDGPSYMVISGESGVGKTNIALKLVMSMYQDGNWKHKSIYWPRFDKKIPQNREKPWIGIEYILIEQNVKNLVKVINGFKLLHPSRKQPVDIEKTDSHRKRLYVPDIKDSGTEAKIKKTDDLTYLEHIVFHEMPMYSTSELITLIEEKEKDKEKEKEKEKDKDKQNEPLRTIYVIDSINALLDASVEEQDWRQVFQAIKSVTNDSNSIVIFIHEKADKDKDSILEYLSDVVIRLYRENDKGEVWRSLEAVESRFQHVHVGRHPFFIKQHHDEAFSVYPLTSAMSGILPLQQAQINPGECEFGIKIDGILNYFEYCHNRRFDMRPFLLKNSITLLDGDRGCNKTRFGYSFAMSAFRDEIRTIDEKIFATDFRDHPPQEIYRYIKEGEKSEPQTKCIGLILHFGEMYNEDQEKDIVWDTFFGKIIFPKCKQLDKKGDPTGSRLTFGQISVIVCFFEMMEYSEDVYFALVWSIIRAVKTYNVGDVIPDSYDDFVKRSLVTDIAETSKPKEHSKGCVYNPTYRIASVEDPPKEPPKGCVYNPQLWDLSRCQIPKESPKGCVYNPFLMIYDEKNDFTQQELLGDDWIDHTANKEIDEPEEKWCYYKDTAPVRVSRLLIDNCENLVDVFPDIHAKSFLSIMAHFCLVSNITTFVVNTVDYGDSNDVDEICQAIADNMFLFRKVHLFGNWYPTLRVARSSDSFHNEMIYHIKKRRDGLLQLFDTFSLISSFDGPNFSLLPIRIFAPGNSKEYIDYMSKIKLTLFEQVKTNEFAMLKKAATDSNLARNMSFNYNFNEGFGIEKTESFTVNKWHNYIKDMISASLSHPDVSVITKEYSISDISIILNNESVKDAVTLMILPGHLLARYQRNLQVISDFISFRDRSKTEDLTVNLINDNKLFQFPKPNGGDQIKFGKSGYYLHTSPTKVKPDNVSDVSDESDAYIVPDLLFNPAVSRYSILNSDNQERNHKIKIKTVNKDNDNKVSRIDIKAYPYYIDPRLDLLINRRDNTENNTERFYLNHTAEDYLTSYIEEGLFSNSGYKFVSNTEELIKKILNGEYKSVTIRDWFSAHQELFNTIIRYKPVFLKDYSIEYKIPGKFLYQTYYLGVPITSPRCDLACEIMVKMAEPHDLENLKIMGIGIPINKQTYRDKKFIPDLDYSKLENALEKYKVDSPIQTEPEDENIGYPIAYFSCYYERITSIGGSLRNIVQKEVANQGQNEVSIKLGKYYKKETGKKTDNLCKSCFVGSECKYQYRLDYRLKYE